MGFSVFPAVSSTIVSSATPATGYTYQRFNASGTFTLPSGYNSSNPLTCDILSIGGGGGGASWLGGGGGAGDVVIASGLSLESNATVVVGAGGALGGLSGVLGSTGGISYVQFSNSTDIVTNYVSDPTANTGTGWSATATNNAWSPAGLGRSVNSVSVQNSPSGSSTACYTAPAALSATYGTDLNGDFGFVNYYYRANDTFTISATANGLTPGTVYYFSMWVMEPQNVSVYSAKNMYYNVNNGTNQAFAITARDQWKNLTGTFTASSSSATLTVGGTVGEPNTGSFIMSYVHVIEDSNVNKTIFTYGGSSTGGSAWAGTAYASLTKSTGAGLVTRAYGGGGGSPGGTSVYTPVASANGGSVGGYGNFTGTTDNVYSGIPVSSTPIYSTSLRNNGGGSSRGLYPYGSSATYAVSYDAAGGGGGATSAGTGEANWQTGRGGNGGSGYNANPWLGSSATLSANLLAGGGSGWGRFGPGIVTHGGGSASTTAPLNTNTVMLGATSPTPNTGAGGAGGHGANNTSTAGASGLIVIRYKA